MRAQRLVIIFLVLALLVGMEVLLMSRCTTEDAATATNPPGTPVPTTDTGQNPEEDLSSPSASPGNPSPARTGYTSPPGSTATANTATRAPAATNPPRPTDAPDTTTPQPVTQAPPAGTVTASNSFSSYTGTGVNMTVSWTATDLGNGTTRLTINGTVNSYNLQVTSLPVSISFSGYTTSLMGNSIDVGDGLHASSLFSTTLDVASGTSGTMTVTWSYNGTYSDVTIASIVASDYVYTN